MRSRIAGGIGVFVLVLVGFVPAARADGFSVGTTALGPNHDVVADSGAWTSTDDFVASFLARNDNGNVGGTWSFKTVNPFRDGDVQKGFDEIGMSEARAFLNSRHAGGKSARLDFTVKQKGDRDANDMGDFAVTLNQATFVPSIPLMPGRGGLSSGHVRLSTGDMTGGLSDEGGVASLGGVSQSMPTTPEPATLILLGSGLAGVVIGVRRKVRARG